MLRRLGASGFFLHRQRLKLNYFFDLGSHRITRVRWVGGDGVNSILRRCLREKHFPIFLTALSVLGNF
jgi:hypothetical protein